MIFRHQHHSTSRGSTSNFEALDPVAWPRYVRLDKYFNPELILLIVGVLGIFQLRLESTPILPHFMGLFMMVLVEGRRGVRGSGDMRAHIPS